MSENQELHKDELPTERNRLLNRAFAVKCIAIVFLMLGVVCIVLWMFRPDNRGSVSPIIILTMSSLLFIPVMIQYYVLDSISISLKSSAELHDKIEELQKMLETKSCASQGDAANGGHGVTALP